MSTLVNKSIKAQIAVYYSDSRKAEMKVYGQRNCNATFMLLGDIISRHDAKVENIIVPSVHDRQVDLILEIQINDNESLEELKKELSLVRSGINKISIFPIA